MYHCRFRALTLDDKPFLFSARDVPVLVYPDQFMLANRPGTPLLKTDSISRVMDHLPLCTGDRVLLDGIPYTVCYHRGFFFTGDGGDTIPSHLVSSYTYLSRGFASEPRVIFKYRHYVFPMSLILGCKDGKAVLSMCRELVNVDELRVNTGFLYRRRKLFFGDRIKGREVVMWRGRPCFRKKTGYVELFTGKLLGGMTNGSNQGCSG